MPTTLRSLSVAPFTVAALALATAMALAPAIAQGPTFAMAPPLAGPGLRTDAAMAFDEARGRSLLFGGQDSGGAVCGDTWEWDGFGWTLRLPATSPSPRFRHAMTYHPTLGPVLYGGSTNGTDALGDMWRWDGATWLDITVPLMPPARQEAAMAWHGGTNPGILLFGGKDAGSVLLNDTWLFQGTTWSLQTSTGPSARWKSAMVHAPTAQTTYLFGGTGPDTSSQTAWAPSVETWLWNGSSWTTATHPTYVFFGPSPISMYEPAVVWNTDAMSLQFSWSHLTTTCVPSGSSPASLSWYTYNQGFYLHFITQSGGAATCFDSVRRRQVLVSSSAFAVVSGGVVSGLASSLAELPSPSLHQWRDRTNVQAPTSRAYTDMAFDAGSGRNVLFGGWNNTAALGDTWSFDGETWTNHGTSTVAAARVAPALCSTNFGLVMFGGGTLTGSFFNDLATWNGSSWQTPSVHPFSPLPPARMNHDMVFDASQQRAVMFGGFHGASLGDTWVLAPQGFRLRWSQIATTGPQPPARNSHRMAYDQQRQRVVMFGGCSASGWFLGDTWELVGNTWQQVFPPQSPSPRWNHAMDYDPVRGVVVLIGGFNGGFANDVWEYDGVTWTQRTPQCAVPIGHEGAGAAWDPVRQRMVLCGGVTWFSSVLADTWFYNGQ